MDLTFKFRDNDNSIKLDIDKNSVLFGFNGTGKTRVLKLLQDLSNKERNKNRLVDLFEQFNVENIYIEGTSFLELLNDKHKHGISIYNEFIEKNRSAFVDFISSPTALDLFKLDAVLTRLASYNRRGRLVSQVIYRKRSK